MMSLAPAAVADEADGALAAHDESGDHWSRCAVTASGLGRRRVRYPAVRVLDLLQ
jgi:hypothetical protein